jgi:hypothetical protein
MSESNTSARLACDPDHQRGSSGSTNYAPGKALVEPSECHASASSALDEQFKTTVFLTVSQFSILT